MRVRGVVGGDAIDRAVEQAGEQRGAVFGGAQRRIHLEIRVVLSDVFIDQREVMRGDLAGYVDAFPSRGGDSAQGGASREVGDMKVSAGFFGQANVALNDGGLGLGGPAAPADAERQGAGLQGVGARTATDV